MWGVAAATWVELEKEKLKRKEKFETGQKIKDFLV